MSRSLVDYLVALCVCLAAAMLYQVIAVPWIELPPSEDVAPEPVYAADEGLPLEGLFPAGSWQLEPTKRLQTDSGVLLFRQWERVDEQQWKLWPVTVILERDRDAGFGPASTFHDPVLLDAPEGAVVQFAEPLDALSGSAPPIQSGRLIGQVHLSSRATRADGSDAIDLRASDLRMDNRRIWTTQPVQLRIGEARIAGRDLTLELASSRSLQMPQADSPLSLFDSMELIYLDKLSVPLPEGGLWEPAADVVAAVRQRGPAEPVATPGWMHVKCGGRLKFDFSNFTLELRDGVELSHQIPRYPTDTLHCQTLSLQLNDPYRPAALVAAPGGPRPAAARAGVPRAGVPPGAATPGTPSAWLRRIEAQGNPITIQIPTLAASGTAEHLVVNQQTGLLQLRSDEGVRLQYGPWEAQLSELTYQLHPDDPTQLGSLVAQGAGRIQSTDPQNPLQELRWNKTLQILGEAETHRLWIAGDLRGQMRDGGSLAAETLMLAFRLLDASPVAAGGGATSRGAPRDRAAATAGSNSAAAGFAQRFQPEHLQVTGNVSVSAPFLAADTDLLQVWFESVAADPRKEAAPGAGVQLTPATGNPLRLWVTQPPEESSPARPAATGPRPKLSGRAIKAQVGWNAGTMSVQDASVYDDVRLEHTLQAPGGEVPMVLSGDELRLVDGGGEDIVQITGRPAKVDLGDGFFEGSLVQIRGRDNLVWIDRAGSFRVPTAALARRDTSRGADASSESPAIEWVTPPQVDWQGQMTFDGRIARIRDGVRLSGRVASGTSGDETWEIQGEGDQLQLVLDQAVTLRQPSANPGVVLQRISLESQRGDVRFSALQSAADGRSLSRHLLHTPQLDLYPTDGRLQGGGPGWYRLWSRSETTRPQRAGQGPRGELMGVHLIYQEGIEGNLARQTLDFVRAVRVGISPVGGWEESFDAASLSQLSEGQGTIDCDRLRLSQSSVGSASLAGVPAWEAEALGGVVFRMRSAQGLIDGTASRAAYAAAKDRFVVEGDPNRPAHFRQLDASGAAVWDVQPKLLIVRPRTMELETMQLHSARATMEGLSGQTQR